MIFILCNYAGRKRFKLFLLDRQKQLFILCKLYAGL
nr:MAG TPA: hypothetical protein [Inoviridae sp.]